MPPQMAKGLFVVGFTVEEVLAIQAKAKALILEGKTMMSYTDSGTSASKQFVMPVAEVLDECGHALQILSPDTYGKRRKYFSANFRSLRNL